MRLALLFVLLASPVFAQGDPSASVACGPAGVKFDVKNDQTSPSSDVPPGKALIYLIEDVGEGSHEWITVRMGLDGSWIGANRGNSFFSFVVQPGDRHLCANWQSSLKRQSSQVALLNFTAEPGKIYYFRTQVTLTTSMERIELAQVNDAEGQHQIASFPRVASHPKK